MDDRAPIFSVQSGVYHVLPGTDSARLEQEAHGHNFRFVDLNGSGATNRQEVIRLMRTAFDLPGHFGGNWDALLDMLRDLSWLPDAGCVVFAHNLEPLSSHDHASYEHLLGVLHDAAAFWGERMQNRRPFIVLLASTQQA